MRVSKSIMLASAAALLSMPAIVFAQAAAPAAGTPDAAAQPASGAATSATAPATPDSPKLAAGSPVFDTSGGSVGTVQSIEGDMVILATAKNKVQLPKTSFALGAKGPVIGMTAAQIDQAAAQVAPQATAAATPPAETKVSVVKGAAVADMQGGAVGTVEDVDAKFATLTLATGGKVRLPVTAFAAGDNGALKVAMTAAQLSAAAGAAGAGKSGA